PGRGAGLRVLLSSYRTNPHVGGQGIYVRALSRALTDAGCTVTVASGPPYPELDPDVALQRLPSLDLFEEKNAFLAFRPSMLTSRADMAEWTAHNTGAFREMKSFALRLERFVKRERGRFDVVHDNQTLAPALARVDRILPVVTTLHHPIAIDRDFAVAGAATWWRKALSARWHDFVGMQAKTARRLPRFLAVSEAARAGYASRCGVDPSRVTVALNGVDHSVFRPAADSRREPGHVVTLASADVPLKGLDVLIDALALMQKTRPDFRLTVVGRLREGPAKRALDRAGLSDRVRFVSGLTNENLAALFRSAAVFVSPSRFEGFGLPAAEAMACGAPVIVSSGGALPEVVGEAGIVTPVEDAVALSQALAKVLGDEALQARMSAASLARARSAFRWDAHAAAAIRLYDAALAQRRTKDRRS
ncbi:MAG: glycosyltransferase family 4 protein, partial [Oceanicaulis sp.]